MRPVPIPISSTREDATSAPADATSSATRVSTPGGKPRVAS